MTDNAALPPLHPTSAAAFTRPADGRIVAGVCAGIAERWQVDVTLVRVVAAVLAVMSGLGVAAYLAIWLLTPSTDAPAPVRPGTKASRLAAGVPAVLLALLLLAVVAGFGHAPWFGLPMGLLVVALLATAVVVSRPLRVTLVVLAVLVTVSVVGLAAFGQRVGLREIHVSSLTDLRDRYDFAAGRVRLDLSSLAVTGPARTQVRVGRGAADITLPRDTVVLVHARAGIGSVTVDGTRVRGVDAEQTRALGVSSPGGDRLVLDVLVGAGSVTVHQ